MSVNLTFYGAARTVTGSSFLIDTGQSKVLVDCGMFQGSKTLKELNYGAFPHDPKQLDAVLLTHAHIDHSGLLPKLMLAGFKGPIHATAATVDLLSAMLPDSGHIQESEVETLNRRARQRGKPVVAPIYTKEDALDCLKLLRSVRYDSWISVTNDIRARFWNAGHLLGSSSIEVEIATKSGPQRLLFSGDLGPDHKLLESDPEAPQGFDYVVCESTYGGTDRADPTPEGRREALAREITAALRPKGALLVPSFAVERTQEFVTDLVTLISEGRLPEMPIFIDSPLAKKASDIFCRHAQELEAGAALRRAFTSPLVRFAETVEESKALARIGSFHVIVSASGMCEAGRIRHHLKNWLWRRDATVLLIGYQAQGTLGRLMSEGAPTVRIQGEEVRVRASIRAIDDYSGHADGPELLAWLSERMPIRKGLFLVHGEDDAMEGLRQRALTLLPESRIFMPAMDATFALDNEPRALEGRRERRIEPEAAGRQDWNNDMARLLIDLHDRMDHAADARAKKEIIRRIRRAMEES